MRTPPRETASPNRARKKAGAQSRSRNDSRLDKEMQCRLLDMIQQAAVVVDRDLNVLYVNNAAERLSGWKAEEVLGRPVTEFIVAPLEWVEARKRILETGESWSNEMAIPRRDGTTFAAAVEGSPLLSETGEIIGLIAVASDITDRKRAEEALRQAHGRLDLAQTAAGMGIWNWDFVTGRFEWSARMYELFGIDPGETNLFESWKGAVHPDDRDRAWARIRRALEEKTTLENEYRIVRPDGSIRWIGSIGHGSYDEDGKPIRMAGVCVDITELRRAEEALRESEEQHRRLFENMTEGFALLEVIFDADGKPQDLRYLAANPAHERQTGVKAEDVIGRTILELFPAAASISLDPALRVVAGEPLRLEQRFEPLDRWFEISVFKVDERRLAAVFQDITERKQAEEALRESEDRYRTLFTSMTQGFALLEVVFDGEGKPCDLRILAVNPAIERQTGRKAEDVVGRRLGELFTDAEPLRFERSLRVLETGEPAEFEVKVGPLERWFEISAFRIDERRFAATVWDITERKQAEEALRESEEKFSSLYMSMVEGVAVYEMTSDGTDRATDALILDVNPAYERLMGMTSDLVVGKRSSEVYAAKRNADVFRMWRRVVSSGEPESMEAYWPVTGKHLSVTAFSLGGDRFANVFHDITEQKQAEEALRESEGRLRRACQAGRIGTYEWNSGTDVVHASPEAKEIFGLEPGSTANLRTWMERTNTDDLQRLADIAELIEQVRTEKQPVRMDSEYRIIRPDGTVVWVQTKDELSVEDGNVVVRGAIQDITGRKRAEEALREHADLLEYAPVLVRNLNNEIMLWNSGMQDMYGYSREEALGRTGTELLRSEYPQPPDEVRAALLRDGHWEGEIQRTRKDGTSITVLAVQKVHRDSSGQPAAIIEVDTDITGRKLAEEQLERLRSEFYGVISHELKTPLTVIKGSAALALSRQAYPDEARELFNVIGDQSDHLAEMVNNLLDMTRIEAGTFSVETDEADVGEIVADALRSFQRAGYRHRIEVKLNRRLPRIKVDKRRVVQVINNLLNNAAKFSPSHQPIAIRAREDADSVVVSVRDRGMGIAADKIPLLFKKYSQLSEAGRGGTGLGLWISASIIEAQGGRIWAESAGLNKGTTFSFTVPKVGADEPQESVPAGSHSLNILAVDDEPSILGIVERFLSVSGHRVVTTTDPFQVRGLVETEEPDVLVLDMKMPGKSGVEVLKEIRQFSEVPVVVITATDNEQEVAKARSFKGVTWLPKPFAPDELLDHVTAAGKRFRRNRTPS